MITKQILAYQDLILHLEFQICVRNKQSHYLPSKEFLILKHLIQHPCQEISKTDLIANLWDIEAEPNHRVINTHVCRLRSKIDNNSNKKLLHTTKNGYMLW